jgi:hypothetical protein
MLTRALCCTWLSFLRTFSLEWLDLVPPSDLLEVNLPIGGNLFWICLFASSWYSLICPSMHGLIGKPEAHNEGFTGYGLDIPGNSAS